MIVKTLLIALSLTLTTFISPMKNNDHSELFYICARKSLTDVKDFIATHPTTDVNYQKRDGKHYALHAAQYHAWSTVFFLIQEKKATIDIRDHYRQTIFSQAARCKTDPKAIHCKDNPHLIVHNNMSSYSPLALLLPFYNLENINEECKNLPVRRTIKYSVHPSTTPQEITYNAIQRIYAITLEDLKYQKIDKKKIEQTMANSINNNYIPITAQLLEYDHTYLNEKLYKQLAQHPEALFVLREKFNNEYLSEKKAALLYALLTQAVHTKNNQLVYLKDLLVKDIVKLIQNILLSLYKKCIICASPEKHPHYVIEKFLWQTVQEETKTHNLDIDISIDVFMKLSQEEKTELNVQLLTKTYVRSL